MTGGGGVIINKISNVCVCKIVVYKFLFLLPKSSYTWCLASFNYTCTIILKFKKSWLSPNVPYNHSKLTTFTSTSVIKIDILIGTVIIHLCFVPLLIQLQLYFSLVLFCLEVEKDKKYITKWPLQQSLFTVLNTWLSLV